MPAKAVAHSVAALALASAPASASADAVVVAGAHSGQRLDLGQDTVADIAAAASVTAGTAAAVPAVAIVAAVVLAWMYSLTCCVVIYFQLEDSIAALSPICAKS